MRDLLVMKFGGTSVANGERLVNVAKLVKAEKNPSKVVVVSAMSGVTDRLIKIAKSDVEIQNDLVVGTALQKTSAINLNIFQFDFFWVYILTTRTFALIIDRDKTQFSVV